jgi:Ca-activated chloride channel family protein
MELNFLKPQFGWFFLVFFLVYIAWRFLNKSNYIASTTLSLLSPVLIRSSLIRQLPAAFLLLAIVLLIFSIMQPVLPMAEREVESQGLDIAIVLDLSESMQEVMDRENLPEESRPAQLERMTMTQQGRTRLQTTKDALRDFIVGRRDDRIGMLVFADHAYIISPLTLDHDFLLHYLDMVDENILKNEKKTAIGDGIALAYSLLLKQQGNENRGQVIMVYTDGEHNFGRDPIEALTPIALTGIKVHLVGVDLEQKIKEKQNVQQLIESIVDYGGSYFDAETKDDLFAASAGIDALEKGRVITREYVQQVPVYHWFVLPAAFFIVIAFALRVFPYFSDYT